MHNSLIIVGLLFCSAFSRGQTGVNENDSTKLFAPNGSEVILSALGLTNIFLKDGSIKTKCILREINDYRVVYIKNKVLHDLSPGKIKMIESDKEQLVIYFDEKNKPFIKDK